MIEPDPKDADNLTWPEIKSGQIEGGTVWKCCAPAKLQGPSGQLTGRYVTEEEWAELDKILFGDDEEGGEE